MSRVIDNYFKQHTDKTGAWHEQRWGKFTASENYKLREKGHSEVFGSGAMSYIRKKALEMTTNMWEMPSLDEVTPMLHGKVHEYPAFMMYVETTGYDFMTYLGDDKPTFLDYEPLAEECGGSPDAVSITDGFNVDIGAEIKCPKDPMNHFLRLDWKDQWAIKDNYTQCYTQIQNLLMITGAKQWDFISFDGRQKLKSKRIKIIPVYPDKKFQDNLHVRIEMAIKEKYKIISHYYDCEIKNRSEFQRLIAA